MFKLFQLDIEEGGGKNAHGRGNGRAEKEGAGTAGLLNGGRDRGAFVCALSKALTPRLGGVFIFVSAFPRLMPRASQIFLYCSKKRVIIILRRTSVNYTQNQKGKIVCLSQNLLLK